MTAAILADFKTSPYLHQLKEFELSADLPSRALLWAMRTGKSKVCIDTACHLASTDRIDTVLVFAPKGVHENWIRRELPLHHWNSVERDTHVWRTSVAGTTAERKGDLAKQEAWWNRAKRLLEGDTLSWFAFNSESMTRTDVRRLVARILKRKRVMVIFDESQDYRSPGSKRTKMARSLAKKCLYRRILTGTVIDNSPLAAFSQYELLEPGALGHRTYGDFKDRYAVYKITKNRKGQRYPVLDKYQNLEEMRDHMAKWSSVMLRKDADLPDVVPHIRSIELNDEQVRLYRELHSTYSLQIEDDVVDVGENTQKWIKFQQIVSGFIIDEFKDVFDIPGVNPRLEAVSDEVYLSSGKVIIWCQFQEDMDRVASRLTADGHKVVEYHGRVSDAEKARVRKLFEPGADNDVKALVGYPTTGLDLSAASNIVWYSHTFDAVKRRQADERATAMGGENVYMTLFVAPGIDGYILESFDMKLSMADRVAGTGLKDALRRMKI